MCAPLRLTKRRDSTKRIVNREQTAETNRDENVSTICPSTRPRFVRSVGWPAGKLAETRDADRSATLTSLLSSRRFLSFNLVSTLCNASSFLSSKGNATRPNVRVRVLGDDRDNVVHRQLKSSRHPPRRRVIRFRLQSVFETGPSLSLSPRCYLFAYLECARSILHPDSSPRDARGRILEPLVALCNCE